MAMIPRFDMTPINVRPDTGFDCGDRDGVGGCAYAMEVVVPVRCGVGLAPIAGDRFVTFAESTAGV